MHRRSQAVIVGDGRAGKVGPSFRKNNSVFCFARPLHNLWLTNLMRKTIGIQAKGPKFTV